MVKMMVMERQKKRCLEVPLRCLARVDPMRGREERKSSRERRDGGDGKNVDELGKIRTEYAEKTAPPSVPDDGVNAPP